MKHSFLSIVTTCISLVAWAQLTVSNLTVENLADPLGVDARQPRLGWQLKSDKRNCQQVAFEIAVAADEKGRQEIWNSGKLTSEQNVHFVYTGPALQSSKRYYWRVRAWDNLGRVSGWSEYSYWEMGLLNSTDWKAKWISPGYTEDSVMRPSPVLRKRFDAKKQIKTARLYITSHGLYKAYINGKVVSGNCLSPGWTSYNQRLAYQVYDVGDLLKTGENAVGVMLGSGWYRGNLAWERKVNIYGRKLALISQLQIVYADGTSDMILSDESWHSSTGEIQYSEIYNGEINDSRLQKKGWLLPGYDEKGWAGVTIENIPTTQLMAAYNEPITKHERFKPLKIFSTPEGDLVADFGQNLVGLVELKVKGKPGDSIMLQHAEVLDKQGNFYTANLRSAQQQNVYVLNGTDEQEFEPCFTFQGFRYVRIKGFPGELKPENITAVAMYSDMQPTGIFTSSNSMINQLQHNIVWGQRGNFLDVPTDCPQRDERLGWTGDAQVFSRTAAYNMHVYNFFSKWLGDLAADQLKNGAVPAVIPDVIDGSAAGSSGWADAATIIPWNMYVAYGDTSILRQQYKSMKAWVDYIKGVSSNYLWNSGWHFGDWLFYRPADDNDGRSAVTDKFLIAQCFFAQSTQLLVNAAMVLGKKEDQLFYSDLLNKIKSAFVKEYMTSSGRLVSGTQTAYVLALNFDMLPDSLRQGAAQRLVSNIKDYNYHLTTGFLGTPYLCHVLTRFGYTDIAYRLLMQETYPSWLYPVKMGATTIWERWDGQKTDGSFQTPGMNSFNHYAYGAIGDWMYRVIAGIDNNAENPGYKKIILKPHVGGGLTKAQASLQTYYGTIGSAWSLDGNNFYWKVEIPANTSATIYLPAADSKKVMVDNKVLSATKDIVEKGYENGYLVIAAGSGVYEFNSTVKE